MVLVELLIRDHLPEQHRTPPALRGEFLTPVVVSQSSVVVVVVVYRV